MSQLPVFFIIISDLQVQLHLIRIFFLQKEQ